MIPQRRSEISERRRPVRTIVKRHDSKNGNGVTGRPAGNDSDRSQEASDYGAVSIRYPVAGQAASLGGWNGGGFCLPAAGRLVGSRVPRDRRHEGTERSAQHARDPENLARRATTGQERRCTAAVARYRRRVDSPSFRAGGEPSCRRADAGPTDAGTARSRASTGRDVRARWSGADAVIAAPRCTEYAPAERSASRSSQRSGVPRS